MRYVDWLVSAPLLLYRISVPFQPCRRPETLETALALHRHGHCRLDRRAATRATQMLHNGTSERMVAECITMRQYKDKVNRMRQSQTAGSDQPCACGICLSVVQARHRPGFVVFIEYWRFCRRKLHHAWWCLIRRLMSCEAICHARQGFLLYGPLPDSSLLEWVCARPALGLNTTRSSGIRGA